VQRRLIEHPLLLLRQVAPTRFLGKRRHRLQRPRRNPLIIDGYARVSGGQR